VLENDNETSDGINDGYEETKEEYIPNNQSSTSNQERNSNSRTQSNVRPINVNDELTNILSNVTEELLSSFLRPSSQENGNLTSSLFDPSYNSFFFDSSKSLNKTFICSIDEKWKIFAFVVALVSPSKVFLCICYGLLVF
jgi:hypothetical protein